MSRKKEGIIGKSSKKTIEKRRQICQDLYASMYNPTKSEFKEAYAKCIRNNKMVVPSPQTLSKDINALGVTFRNGFRNSNPQKTAFGNMGHKINYYLKQIRINCALIDIVLYDSNNYSIVTSKENFLKPLEHLMDANNNIDSIVITDTSLVCLSFILNCKGFETYIEDVFDRNCKIFHNYLYSETHNYCTKIFFEYKKLNEIMDYVYYTVSMLNIYD